MSVINIKDAPSDWAENQQFAYIGRYGKGQNGYFGNPIVRGMQCPICSDTHMDAGSTLKCFEIWMLNKIKTDQIYKDRIESLREKTLVCFCAPRPCHGNVIEKYLNLPDERR